jgi:SET domain-containing protein
MSIEPLTPEAPPRSPRASRTSTPAAEEPIVVVRRSPIHGRGVYAARDIAKGEFIIEYLGERITSEEANDRYDDERMRKHHTFLFAVNDRICIDARRGGNEARFINHSCEPNCDAEIERARIFIYAARAIRAGEELLYDYWYSTDSTYTEEELKRIYPCRCGSPKCRGTLASVKKTRTRKAS